MHLAMDEWERLFRESCIFPAYADYIFNCEHQREPHQVLWPVPEASSGMSYPHSQTADSTRWSNVGQATMLMMTPNDVMAIPLMPKELKRTFAAQVEELWARIQDPTTPTGFCESAKKVLYEFTIMVGSQSRDLQLRNMMPTIHQCILINNALPPRSAKYEAAQKHLLDLYLQLTEQEKQFVFERHIAMTAAERAGRPGTDNLQTPPSYELLARVLAEASDIALTTPSSVSPRKQLVSGDYGATSPSPLPRSRLHSRLHNDRSSEITFALIPQ